MIGTVSWDDRPAERDGPFNGWFAELELLVGLGGTYEYPETVDQTATPFMNFLAADAEPIKVVADIRRYFGFGDLEINLRATGGGSITSHFLTPEVQISSAAFLVILCPASTISSPARSLPLG